VRLGTLLDDHEGLGPVIVRAGKAPAAARFITGLPEEGAGEKARGKTQGHQGLTFNALAADKGGRHMEPFIVDIEPTAAQEKSTHEGEEFIYVLSGKISLAYGKDDWELDTGDSIYYDSIVPHRVLAAGGPAQILAVIYSPV
jgi:quercetin dioxygenase-like cupin family protein